MTIIVDYVGYDNIRLFHYGIDRFVLTCNNFIICYYAIFAYICRQINAVTFHNLIAGTGITTPIGIDLKVNRKGLGRNEFVKKYIFFNHKIIFLLISYLENHLILFINFPSKIIKLYIYHVMMYLPIVIHLSIID